MKHVSSLLLAVALLFTSSSHAYDIDTHFYGTYSMARFAGIRHEVAVKLAMGAQWMDEAYISEPLSMIIFPATGVKKRRLLHFPGTVISNEMTIDELKKTLGPLGKLIDPSTGDSVKTFTKTVADHDFASEMINEGFLEGNLMKVSVGLHTLEDSFAHAGTLAEMGHAHFWHHPDRPYVNDESIKKYFRMTLAVFKVMVAVRSLVPMDALDMNVKFGTIPNYQLSADELNDIYENHPLVRKAITRKILNDPEYVSYALSYVFKKAEKSEYVRNGYQNYLNKFTLGNDAYQAATEIVSSLPPEMLNIGKSLKDVGLSQVPTKEYLSVKGGPLALISEVVLNLMDGYVPRPLDAYNLFEKEQDKDLWIKELDLRVANMQALIKAMYGTDLQFVKNNTSHFDGFIKEIKLKKDAVTPAPEVQRPGVEYVSYRVSEKRDFNLMIFQYVFPKTFEFIKGDLPTLTAIIRASHDLNRKDKTWSQKFLDRVPKTIEEFTERIQDEKGLIVKLPEMLLLVREDLSGARIRPRETNRYYTVPEVLESQIYQGHYKQLINHAELKKMILQKKF